MTFRVGLLSLVLPMFLVAVGCSAVTDFDRFEEDGGDDDDDMMGDDDDDDDDACADADEGTPCTTDGVCVEAEGVCREGTCVADTLEAGTACELADGAICLLAECDGEGGCGVVEADANDGCSPAELPALVPDLDPGVKDPTMVNQCLTDDVTASCTPDGAPDAFFTVETDVPRLLRVDLQRQDGGRLLRPRAVSVFVQGGGAGCDLSLDAELTCAASAPDDDLPLEQVFFPGSYVVAVDVAPGPDADFPPPFRVRTIVDPQATCAAPPLLPAPAIGEELFFEGSTLDAENTFDTATPDLDFRGPDHVYEIEITEAGRYGFDVLPIPDDSLGPRENNHPDPSLTIRSACANDPANVISADDDGQIVDDPATERADEDVYPSIEAHLQPGTYFIVVDGFSSDAAGSYQLRLRREPGQIIVIGHDYFNSTEGMDQILFNAVTPQTTRFRVVGYDEFSDTTPLVSDPPPDSGGRGGEATVTDWLLLNHPNRTTFRPLRIVRVSDGTRLADALVDADVLLLYEAENGFTMTDMNVATVQRAVREFVAEGGVVVVTDWQANSSTRFVFADDLIPFAEGPDADELPDITGVTSQTLDVILRNDPLTRAVGAAYGALSGSSAFPGTSFPGIEVVSRTQDASRAPVVFRRVLR